MRVSPERITLTLVISSCLMHVFCCGLPLLASLLNMAASLGIASAEVAHSEWFEQFERGAIALSAVMLVVTGIILYVSRRVDCRKQGMCVHPPCDNKKSMSLLIYRVTAVLFAVNLLIFSLGH